MLEEVLQGGRVAIGEFLREFPDSTGQRMADNLGGFFGRIGSFAEMSEDSANRAKRIYESTVASLYDTDLSILGIDIRDEPAGSELGASDMPSTPSAFEPEMEMARNFTPFAANQTYNGKREKMGEKKTVAKSLCRSLPAVNEEALDDAARESFLRIKMANEAAGELVKYVDQIASHLEFSGQLGQIHSQLSACMQKLEQALGSVFRAMGNEVSDPDKLARAASLFDVHLPDVKMVVGNIGKIIEKTSELQSLASDEIRGVESFYSQEGNTEDRKLVAKSAVARSFMRHNEMIVGKIRGYADKTTGRMARISSACDAWGNVQSAMRERNRAIETVLSAFRSAPCKMPNPVYESISGNGYSFRVREIQELQNVVRESVKGIVGGLSSRVESMLAAQPMLERFEAKHVNRTPIFPSYVLLNETRYRSRDDGWIKVDLTVPHVHLFPFANPMSIPDKGIAQILLLRLATALPLGCCDITVLDQDAQGGSVLGIATMKNVPGLMNLIARRDQVADAIKELYEYSGRLVEEGYFTTEEPDWKSYNEKHPDSPLPYKVLVVFSLAGLERVTDGKSMLQSLMKNGCKRGIHVVFAGEAHNQVCGDDKAYEADRRSIFSDIAIDVVRS